MQPGIQRATATCAEAFAARFTPADVLEDAEVGARGPPLRPRDYARSASAAADAAALALPAAAAAAAASAAVTRGSACSSAAAASLPLLCA